MKYRQHAGGYTFIFKKGEKLITEIEGFAKQKQISAASFHGLGGALEAEIGYYHLDKKAYEFMRLDEVLEIVSLHGNIALKDGAPIVHAHGVLSDAELKTYGGHIKEMIVGGTCELFLQSFDESWERMHDEDTGLSLIDFS